VRALRRLTLGALVLLAPWPAVATPISTGECSGPGGPGRSHCLYRSLMPSTGIVADCRSDSDCRVGYYYGEPSRATWFTAPVAMSTMPKPEVLWHTATFAETRIGCGRSCTWSYFFEAKRRFLSAPRRDVLDVDYRRMLMAQADGRALAIRHIFSARDVLRIERDWAPGLSVGQAITEIRFDPDGRLTFTWLKGPGRERVSERVSVPSFAR
jgi:hypothetical protein